MEENHRSSSGVSSSAWVPFFRPLLSTNGTRLPLSRWVADLGVGRLSVLTPMYQSETAPRYIRGALVSCYQLFITLGIFVAYCTNFGTEPDNSPRLWCLPMGTGMLFMRESPRWDYRHGNIDRA